MNNYPKVGEIHWRLDVPWHGGVLGKRIFVVFLSLSAGAHVVVVRL